MYKRKKLSLKTDLLKTILRKKKHMKKQGRVSTKMIILIPVFILGIVSIISSFLAVSNIRSVNANATQIANR